MALTASQPEPIVPGGDVGPVYIDAAHIRYLERQPVRVELVVEGSLPTPCHEVAFEVRPSGDAVDVLVWSLAQPDRVCVDVLEPFAATIPLGSFETGGLPVRVNGEEVGRIEVGPVPVGSMPAGPSLVGAGWSFGMCLGYCLADLVIDGDAVVVTGRGRGDEAPLYVNRGTLTAEGRARIDAALAALAGTALEPVYGCPDCADGGAAYVAIARDGITERIDMEFGDPPPELAELSSIVLSMMGALETCVPNDLLRVADDCSAHQGV